MNDSTQVSGNIRPDNAAIRGLKSMLALIGIQVTRPIPAESLLNTTHRSAWQHYERELAFYGSIAQSPFHIIYNDGEIDEQIATQIVYAMLKHRPILMTGTPVFSRSLSPFLRGVIIKHMQQFHSVHLPDLELTELSLLLGKLKPVDYSLSKHESTLMRARTRAHFRSLLASTE